MGAQMSTDDTLTCLHEAARRLAYDGPVKERLVRAWTECLADLDPITLPDELHPAYTALQCALQSTRALPGETEVRASVRKMSGAEAARHAALIIDLLVSLCRSRQMAVQRRMPARAAGESPVVELFAAEG